MIAIVDLDFVTEHFPETNLDGIALEVVSESLIIEIINNRYTTESVQLFLDLNGVYSLQHSGASANPIRAERFGPMPNTVECTVYAQISGKWYRLKKVV